MSVHKNVTKVDNFIRRLSMSAKVYVFLVLLFYLGMGVFCIAELSNVPLLNQLGLFSNADLRAMVQAQEEQLAQRTLEMLSFQAQNAELKGQLEEIKEVLADYTADLEALNNRKVTTEEILQAIYFAIGMIILGGFIIPSLKFNDHQPQINIINMMLKDLEFVLDAFLRMNSLEYLEFFDLSPEDHQYIEEHLRKLIKALKAIIKL